MTLCNSTVLLKLIYLPDPRGAVQQGFKIVVRAYSRALNPYIVFMSVRPKSRLTVSTSPFCFVLSYAANIPPTPIISTDSEPPVKFRLEGLIKSVPTPNREGLKKTH